VQKKPTLKEQVKTLEARVAELESLLDINWMGFVEDVPPQKTMILLKTKSGRIVPHILEFPGEVRLAEGETLTVMLDGEEVSSWSAFPVASLSSLPQ